MSEGFVYIGDVPTHIFTRGNWIEESFNKKEMVLCITGNPGLPGYYTQFAKCVYDTLGREIPVWIIGHAGHDEPKDSVHKVPPLEGNEHLYGMDGQIQHKVEFIRRYIPADVKIHLVGHSIGSWLSLELLKIDDISQRIHQCYFLFPTFERMVETPNGRLYTAWLQRFWTFIYMIAVVFSWYPTIVHVLVLRAYFYMTAIPVYFIGTTLKYMRPSVLKKIVFMADEEMIRVREADDKIIERNKHRIKFYYGAIDGWTPTEYCEELKKRIPNVDATIDNRQINHAFVLRSSNEMGSIVADWIKEHRLLK